ncbi:repetitive proline-rich cell wall protein isoform X8 [Plutella xylostella]|uniref:repetitive proline-rich cell wall protein isoform X8 n=1 Tax=Plutella xylostella TaxID=51655 RepID=UPI002032A6CD|nr:repetitive proline-rich cell wall protein isoform X8 [Plutella xylostella]
MKTAVIFLGVIVAMASARNGVQVAENSGYNQNGGFQVDPGFGKPSFGQGQGSIDPGFGRPTYGNGNNGQIVDPGFYRPSVGQPQEGEDSRKPPNGPIVDLGFEPPVVIDAGFQPPSGSVIVDQGYQPPGSVIVDPGFQPPGSVIVDPGSPYPSVPPCIHPPPSVIQPGIELPPVVDAGFQPPPVVPPCWYPPSPGIELPPVELDPGFNPPPAVGSNRPSPSSFYPGQNQHQIIDSGFYRPSVNPGQNPPQIIDPGFNVRPQPGYGHYAPSHPNFGQTNSGLPQPGFGPTFVNEQPQNNGGWPRKQYNNPALRGGK